MKSLTCTALVELKGGAGSAETLGDLSRLLPFEGTEKYDHYTVSEISSSGDAIVTYVYSFDCPDMEDDEALDNYIADYVNTKTREIAENLEKSCKGKYAWTLKLR